MTHLGLLVTNQTIIKTPPGNNFFSGNNLFESGIDVSSAKILIVWTVIPAKFSPTGFSFLTLIPRAKYKNKKKIVGRGVELNGKLCDLISGAFPIVLK